MPYTCIQVMFKTPSHVYALSNDKAQDQSVQPVWFCIKDHHGTEHT